MPAKWQQWMPFKIDAFKGSPSVQAMHPAARAGYLYLLSCAWQSDDCTLPGDDLNLAEMSGLGDELWGTFGARIRRKFSEGPDGRLMNPVLFDEWNEAKRIFEARQASAQRTNTERSKDGHRAVTEQSPSRSADTITGTVTITSTKEQKPTPKAPPSSFTLPLWIDPPTWEAWIEMRKKIPRAPFTDKARAGILEDLRKLKEWGIDPNDRLREGMKKAWRGVLFDSDKPGNGKAKANAYPPGFFDLPEVSRVRH